MHLKKIELLKNYSKVIKSNLVNSPLGKLEGLHESLAQMDYGKIFSNNVNLEDAASSHIRCNSMLNIQSSQASDSDTSVKLETSSSESDADKLILPKVVEQEKPWYRQSNTKHLTKVNEVADMEH
mgnify:CR=1 FL=1|tara:strand:- start:319 stop:693 length:375 start_codon:yes stop_codon:yes gene_type:complete